MGLIAGSLLHCAVLAAGPKWIAFVGAPDVIVVSAMNGTWVAPAATLTIAAFLAGLALYSLAAAAIVRPLPGVKPVLWTAALVFVMRGLLIVPALVLGRFNWRAPVDLFITVSSAGIATIGLALVAGLILADETAR